MKLDPKHCLTALGGAAVLALLPQVTTTRQRVGVLTAEQLEILGHLSIVYLDDGQGGMAKTLRVEGVNLQIVNGLGATNGDPDAPTSTDPFFTVTNGLGNLIVGYNELSTVFPNDRTGSHNVVAGQHQSYSSFGGLITSRVNHLNAPYSTITGGTQNRTEWLCSSVNGGSQNVPSEYCSSVCGGVGNTPTARYSWIGGGEDNVASGERSAVSGGVANLASEEYASVSGGKDNVASGTWAWIGGGLDNQASGNASSVSGGTDNVASEFLSSVGGGRANTADGYASSVSGGLARTISVRNTSGVLQDDWIGGSLWEDD